MVDWHNIDTVLLDMDGTLLDLHYDNHFWLEHLPLRYAQQHGLAPQRARDELHARYRAVQGTLQWYCIDYWSEQLQLDVALLKEELQHLIAVHPHVVEFLEALRNHRKRVILVTNSHVKGLRLKMARTGLERHFDQLISSHDFGMPKEHPAFWHHLQKREPFDPQRTLFVDDSLPVLRSAQHYGIAWLLAIYRPDSRQGERDVEGFAAIHDFRQILPVTG